MARLIPNGICWCGCDQEASRGAFFRPGHDKFAEAAVIAVEYGGVAEFLQEHGYGPGGSNARRAVEAWKASGQQAR